jgi:cell division protein FtsI (penicillin-binding protein 3)
VDDKKNIALRVYLVYAVICLIGLTVMIRVFRIQVDTVSVTGESEELLTTTRTIEAVRGNIYSDNGSLLATSVPVYEVRMDMKADGLSSEVFLENVDSLAMEMANLFHDKSHEQYYSALVTAHQEGNRYFLLHAKVRYPDLQKMKKFPILRLGKNKGGIIINKENKRSRPYGLLAARLIGYERPDAENPSYIARVGLEGAFGNHLQGTNGEQLMRKVGLQWRPVSDKFEVKPVDGADLHTSIDINIQDVAENALLEQMKEYNAKSGCVVLMEVKTGYIKAMANLSRNEDGEFYEYFNQAIGVATEPGSTFKLPSLMVALEDGLIHPMDSVKTGNGTYKYHDLTMTDSKPHGTITIEEAFAVSSNIGCSRPIFEKYRANPKKYIEGLERMGIGEMLGLDITGEAKPYLKNPGDSDWSGVTLPQMAIGYEVRLAPIQILTFYNAVANAGKMVKPLFVKEIKRNGKVIETFEPVVLREKICSDKTLEAVQAMLEAVVERGTAENLKAANFKIAGKTGTAQIYQGRSGYGGDGRKAYLASFVGYFPADDPKYTCIVSISEPNIGQGYYGNVVAGSVFKEIADKLYSRSLEIHEKLLRDITVKKEFPATKSGRQSDIRTVYDALKIRATTADLGAEWAHVVTEDGKGRIERKDIADNSIPDVRGMGLKDAMFLLETRGLNVKVKGSGRVRRQSLPVGHPVRKGDEILIELM